MKLYIYLILGTLLLSAIPLAIATTNPTCNAGANTSCYHLNFNNALAGIIGGGDVEVYITYPPTVAEANSVFHIGIGTFAPATTTPVMTYTALQLNGCTLSAFTTTAVATTQTFQAWGDTTATMTDTTCTGLVETKYVGGAVATTILDMLLPFTIYSTDAAHNTLTFLCAATGSTSENYNPATNTCSTPTVNAALSGTINTVVSGSLTISGTINVVNSGGQAITISSWPSLLATLSGGITITDDANGWAIHQDALSGSVSVVNSGGQNVAITSWPQLQAVLSGSVGVDILDDTTNDGMLTVPVNTFNGNITNNTNITEQNGFTPNIVKGTVILWVFILAIAVAEWKKDAIYHLLAALIGALTMVSTVDHLGVPRLIILAVVIYQFWRMFNVMGNNRNNIQKASSS